MTITPEHISLLCGMVSFLCLVLAASMWFGDQQNKPCTEFMGTRHDFEELEDNIGVCKGCGLKVVKRYNWYPTWSKQKNYKIFSVK